MVVLYSDYTRALTLQNVSPVSKAQQASRMRRLANHGRGSCCPVEEEEEEDLFLSKMAPCAQCRRPREEREAAEESFHKRRLQSGLPDFSGGAKKEGRTSLGG
jgi:hypothetical protein